MQKQGIPTYKILVVDDEPVVLEGIKKYASSIDYLEFNGCCSPKVALSWVDTHDFDIALIDYKMPQMNGLELAEALKSKSPESYYLIMTAYGSLETAVEAIRVGIFDFIFKPFEKQEFEVAIQRVINHLKLKDQNRFLEESLKKNYGIRPLIGQSNEMIFILEKIKLFSRSDAPVLITGETGVGKEVVARMIHASSNRSKAPFVVVNCSAYVETLMETELFGHEKGAFTGADRQRIGRLELVKSGSILLDELCEIPPQMQVKFLRVLQEMEFERVGGNNLIKLQARIMSATNRNIEEEIQNSRFREDLLYRLNTLHIHIPPLRERKGDIDLLASHFLRKYSLIYDKKISSFSDRAMDIISNHPWPGNVRQLENVIDSTVLCCDNDKVCEEHLPVNFLQETLPPRTEGATVPKFSASEKREDIPSIVSNLERERIAAQLEKNKWNKTKTAASLGLTRSQLLYRLKKYGIK